MADLTEAVTFYVDQLTGAAADDAWHSLLELGPSALSEIIHSFRIAKAADVRLRLAQVIAHSRAPAAIPFLVELLEDRAPDIWKTALDGFVMLGTDYPAMREPVFEILAAATRNATPTKSEWIVEAIRQIPPLDAAGPV